MFLRTRLREMFDVAIPVCKFLLAHKLTNIPSHITQQMKCQKMHTIRTTK